MREEQMTSRKKIALLLGNPEEKYQSLFIEGFLKQTFFYNYDVCVFAMYNKYQETEAREKGESTIFSLVNYALFDGIVIISDTIQTPGLVDKIEEDLKNNFDGPVICIDKESKYFTSLMTGHYSVVKRLISHLIEVHDYEDIAYLTGKEDNFHSKARLDAYLDCMKEHDLPIKDNRTFYGDFWYGCGDKVVTELMHCAEGMPQAIACANDCMAISVAVALEANGFVVPDDIAVIGYDSIDEGRKSPKPITSAPMPAKENGRNAAKSIKALIENKDITESKDEVELFIGKSCGCKNCEEQLISGLRDSWKTVDFQENFRSRFNYMMEDVLSKSDFQDLMNTVFAYVYHLGEYESFSLCLNSQWCDLEQLHNGEQDWSDYTDKILPVIRCRKDGSLNRINYTSTFDKGLLIPELHENRDTPSAFFFTPLYFDERCLGYAVVSYGNEIKTYNETYWLWLRNVMQGLESFRRVDEMRHKYELLEASQTRDTLTGLYNYQGMMHNNSGFVGKYVGAIVIDIRGLADINDNYGRAEGNYAIKTVAGILKNKIEHGMCGVLGNGEFVGVEIFDEAEDNQIRELRDELLDRLVEVEGLPYTLSVYVGCESAYISTVKDLEHLINTAVAQKNGNKISEQKMMNKERLTDEEFKEMMVVQDIMDNNRLSYHFQPIVNAKTGDIYAYEALMRAESTPYVSPLTILKYADYMGRLYDVERLTFFNVLEKIGENEALFEGKKVFINSIPDNRLQGHDADILEHKLKKYSATVVVELTEQAEVPDDELALMKKIYASMGIETAVDDYGTGYSNVTNLLRYMPDYVKIDRMLLTEIQESPQKQHFVREIIDFAHDNNIKTLAEGVETIDELQMLIRLGVDLIQGYYTARPTEKILPCIDNIVKDEIVRCYRQMMAGKGSRIYIAGKESRIHLAKLVADKYSGIEIVPDNTIHKDVTLSGIAGVTTNLVLDVRAGYSGRIVLDNVNLSAGKRNACINIGENCKVTLVLKGDNRLKDGGIRVADGSVLVIEGDGDLCINSEKDDYFGIGNDVESAHGSIIFDQDGCVEIRCNGEKGVGIGSGKGGIIDIRRGKYIIELTGEKGVGIGTQDGDVNINIAMCNISLRLVTTNNVGIGSMYGNVDVTISHILLKCVFGGTFSAGIGTLYGNRSNINIANSNISLNLRAIEISAIGAAKEESYIEVKECGLTIKGEGREAISFGNANKNCKMTFIDCDVDSEIKSNLESDVGAQESDIKILNGRMQFVLNGREIIRKAQNGDL